MAGVTFSILKNQTISSLENQGFKVDYLELANQNDLQIITEYNKESNLVILVAAFLNEVRLIDNLLIN